MEKELNIAAILNDKPTETKLWSPMLGDCIYCYNNTYPEEIIIAFTDKNGEEKEWTFSYSGRTISAPDTADVCLFPSKQMQDWSKFAWKKGDILVNDDKNVHIIFEAFENDTYTRFKGKHYLWKEGNEEDYCKEETFLLTSVFEKVNDDAVKCYINIIEERLGGKLNRETLEVEKAQPEFKDGDIVYAESNTEYPSAIFIYYAKYKAISYACLYLNEQKTFHQNSYVYVGNMRLRLATEEQKKQLFDALAKKGKAWDAEKKQVVDLKPKCELKPFDKVLVRNTDTEEWFPGFFEKFDSTWNNPYHIMNRRSMTDFAFKQCIPYEGNESLLGTTKDVEG